MSDLRKEPPAPPPTHSLAKSIWRASLMDRQKISTVFGERLAGSLVVLWCIWKLEWPSNLWPELPWWQITLLILVRSIGIAGVSTGTHFLFFSKTKHFMMARQIQRERGIHCTPDWVDALDSVWPYRIVCIFLTAAGFTVFALT